MSGGYCFGKPQHLSRDAAIDAYIELFRQAIRRRRPMDENFVVPLSGGRDSRHILFTLCHVGWRPRFAVTIPRYPPRAPEDERVAALVAAAAGVEHRLLRQDAPRLHAELRKNWLTKLCADEHAWYMDLIDYLQANATTVYDGMGGTLSAASRFLSRRTLGLFEAGSLEELAAELLDRFGLYTEAMLERFLHPRFRSRMSRDVAIARLARDLQRHLDAPESHQVIQFLEPDATRDRPRALRADAGRSSCVQSLPGPRRVRSALVPAAVDAFSRAHARQELPL